MSDDREQRLQRLAAENSRWAEAEERLGDAIRRYQRRLKQLPTIIRDLEKVREQVTAEMLRTGAEHDALEAEDDAEFKERANDMMDDYADHRLAVQPPVGW